MNEENKKIWRETRLRLVNKALEFAKDRLKNISQDRYEEEKYFVETGILGLFDQRDSLECRLRGEEVLTVFTIQQKLREANARIKELESINTFDRNHADTTLMCRQASDDDLKDRVFNLEFQLKLAYERIELLKTENKDWKELSDKNDQRMVELHLLLDDARKNIEETKAKHFSQVVDLDKVVFGQANSITELQNDNLKLHAIAKLLSIQLAQAETQRNILINILGKRS